MLSSIQKLLLATCAATAVFATVVPKTSNVFDVTIQDENDLVVYLTDGTHTVMNHSEWAERLQFHGVLLQPPEVNQTFLDFEPGVSLDIDGDGDSDLKVFFHNVARSVLPRGIADKYLPKRQFDKDITSQVIDRTLHFVDWDVQMSNVICAISTTFSVFVTQGYSVSNTLQVTGGINTNDLAKALQASFGFSASRSWTTESSQQNKGDVAPGTCGVMITKPLITRRYGRVYKGRPGNRRQVGTFMADDHGSGSYNNIPWISGAVSMCAKKGHNPPLSRCQGQGYFT